MAMSRLDYIRLTGMAPATNAASPQSGPVLHSGIGAGLDGIVTSGGLQIGAGGASATAKIGGSAFILIAVGIAAFYILTKERQF